MAKVAVITGATSGIGRATAVRFARGGYNVVLAGRRLEALDEAAAECREAGGQALPVQTDVMHEQDVAALAQAAIDRFGGINVWVNNAGTTVVGAFERIPGEDFRQVIETNFFGYVYGARAALRWFMGVGKGTLINVDSVFGAIPSPYESPYVASKYAVRGFSGALREELLAAGHKDIHVCTVLPAAVDTPAYRHSGNYSGQALKPPFGVRPASNVADAIFKLSEHPHPEIVVGASGRAAMVLHGVMPTGLFEGLFARYVGMSHFLPDQAGETSGNIFRSAGSGAIGGDWSKGKRRKVVIGTTVAGAALATAWWLTAKKRSAS